jgi:hypothetical protein
MCAVCKCNTATILSLIESYTINYVHIAEQKVAFIFQLPELTFLNVCNYSLYSYMKWDRGDQGLMLI